MDLRLVHYDTIVKGCILSDEQSQFLIDNGFSDERLHLVCESCLGDVNHEMYPTLVLPQKITNSEFVCEMCESTYNIKDLTNQIARLVFNDVHTAEWNLVTDNPDAVSDMYPDAETYYESAIHCGGFLVRAFYIIEYSTLHISTFRWQFDGAEDEFFSNREKFRLPLLIEHDITFWDACQRVQGIFLGMAFGREFFS